MGGRHDHSRPSPSPTTRNRSVRRRGAPLPLAHRARQANAAAGAHSPSSEQPDVRTDRRPLGTPGRPPARRGTAGSCPRCRLGQRPAVRTSLETRAPLRDGTRFDELPRPPESRPAATPRTGLPAELRAALHAMFGLLETTAQGPCAFYKDSAELHRHQQGHRRRRHRLTCVPGPMGYDLASSS